VWLDAGSPFGKDQRQELFLHHLHKMRESNPVQREPSTGGEGLEKDERRGLDMKIVFFDISKEKIDAAIASMGTEVWKYGFLPTHVSAINLMRNDAIVAAGNSFGIMDGGLDEAMNHCYPGAEKAVQTAICDQYFGELPVGCAVSVPLKRGRMIYAPTMQVPMNITHTANVYYAMLAVLRLEKRANTLYVPLLGAGAGGLSPQNSVNQMAAAIASAIAGGWSGSQTLTQPLNWTYATNRYRDTWNMSNHM
jgi:O-acetyl-ADP-ribose deacetylase (regulator of RNase III)